MQLQSVPLDGLSQAVNALQASGKTAMAIGIDGRPAGVIALSDTVKEGSAEAIAELRRIGCAR